MLRLLSQLYVLAVVFRKKLQPTKMPWMSLSLVDMKPWQCRR